MAIHDRCALWRGLSDAGECPAYREHLERSVLPQLRKLPAFWA